MAINSVHISCVLFFLTLFSYSNCSGEELENRNFLQPEDVIDQMYRDFAWEVLLPPRQNIDYIAFQTKNVLNKYFDENLTSLLLKDSYCAKSKKTICALDFDPIFASQDVSASDLVISKIDKSFVNVKYLHPFTRKHIHLSYKMRLTKNGWRVADIFYKNENNESLKGILEKYWLN